LIASVPTDVQERSARRTAHERAAAAAEQAAARHDETAAWATVMHGAHVAAAFRRQAALARERAALEVRLAAEFP